MQNENKLTPVSHVRILSYYTPCHLYMRQAKNLLQCVSSCARYFTAKFILFTAKNVLQSDYLFQTA